jgi:TRAP transporter TAXI family solute receptor
MGFRHIALALAAAAAVATSAAAQTISIGTSQAGSLNNSLGNALGKVMGDAEGLKARVVPFGGGQVFLPSINAKSLEMAIPSASDALFAYQGKGPYEGKPSPALRSIGTVFPFYIGWYVRKDSPYKKLSDLRGKKVAVGYNTNSAQRQIVLAFLAAEGMTENDFDGVPVPHVVRAADDFAQGRVEAASFAIGAGKVAEVDVKVGGVRYLSMTNTPEAQARLRKVDPTAYIALLNPAPRFVGVVGPTAVIFQDYLVVTGTQLSDEAAYKVARVLHDHQDKLAGVAKTFLEYKKEGLTRDRGLPFHPGAIKFYKEKGIWPAKS